MWLLGGSITLPKLYVNITAERQRPQPLAADLGEVVPHVAR